MNRTCFVGFLALSVILIAVTEGIGKASDGEAQGKLIRVRGSNAMARMIDDLGKAFVSASPGTSVIVTGGGTDAGFEALFDKAADLVMASRKVFVKELQAAALNDCRLKEVEIGLGAVAVITHPSNPVKELTLEQLGKILKGEMTNWKDVGGPNEQITVYMGQPVSGTALYLREYVMGNDYFGSDVKLRDYYHHMIRDVAKKKPPALAYAPLLDASVAQGANMVKILGLKRSQDSPPVYPSVATVKDKSYPVSMSLYFYWDEETSGPALNKFVEFCRTRYHAGK